MSWLRAPLVFVSTIVLAWLGWNTAVSFGIGWQYLPFPQALAGGSLLALVLSGYLLAFDRSDR